MNNNLDNFSPIVGSDAPKDRIRVDLPCAPDVQNPSFIDLHIFQLLSLHPNCGPQFRNNDLAQLDTNTKQILLQDLKDAIGIQDFVRTIR